MSRAVSCSLCERLRYLLPVLSLTATAAATDPLRHSEVVGVWVGSIGSLLAVVAAVLLAWWEVARARRERERVHEEERQAQASEVFAWVETDEREGRWYASLRFQNASRFPVWDFRVEVWFLEPAPEPERRMLVTRDFLPPGSPVTMELGETIYYTDNPSIPLDCSFRDAKGTLWRKTEDGLLFDLSRGSERLNRALKRARARGSKRLWFSVIDGIRRIPKKIRYSWDTAPEEYRNADSESER